MTEADPGQDVEPDDLSREISSFLIGGGIIALVVVLLLMLVWSPLSPTALKLLACELVLGSPLIVIGGLLFCRGVIFFRLGECLGIEHSERRGDPRRRACPRCGERRLDDRLRCRACGEDVFRRIHEALAERPATNAPPMADCPWCTRPLPTDRA